MQLNPQQPVSRFDSSVRFCTWEVDRCILPERTLIFGCMHATRNQAATVRLAITSALPTLLSSPTVTRSAAAVCVALVRFIAWLPTFTAPAQHITLRTAFEMNQLHLAAQQPRQLQRRDAFQSRTVRPQGQPRYGGVWTPLLNTQSCHYSYICTLVAAASASFPKPLRVVAVGSWAEAIPEEASR
jgi:hypothetical protein